MLRGTETQPRAMSDAGVLVLFVLVVVGCVQVVTVGMIFAGLRAWTLAHVPPLGRMLRCPLCFGFWAGLAWCALGLFPALALPRVVRWVAAAFAGSGVSWVSHVVLCRLGAREL